MTRTRTIPKDESEKAAGRKPEVMLRIVSAVVLAALALAATWFSPWSFLVLVMVGGGLIAWEWGRLTGGNGFDGTALISAVAVTAVAVLGSFRRPDLALFLATAAGATILFAAPSRPQGVWALVGLLYAAPSAGSLLATLVSRWTNRVHRHGLAVTLAAAAWGAAIVGFGLSRTLWLALLFLVLAGAADMVSGLFRSVIWNQTIPDHMRGRLAGIEMLSYTIGPTLGNARAGATARFTGVGGSIVWGGVLCLVGTAALAAVLPAFLRYDGRDGLKRKIAEDESWAAQASDLRPVAGPSVSEPV